MFRDCDLIKLCRLWTGVEYKKWRISRRRICLVLKRSVDKGNLFVLEVEFISFSRRAFVCLERCKPKYISVSSFDEKLLKVYGSIT